MEPAEETAALVKEAGGEALVSIGDTVDFDAARRLMEAAAERFGRVDVLVNDAGITGDKMPIALQRYGEPEDVANAHLFLASDEADCISGVVLPVFGGHLGA